MAQGGLQNKSGHHIPVDFSALAAAGLTTARLQAIAAGQMDRHALAALRGPVDAFFDGVMVNAEQADLRLNRLGLLASLHQAMNRVADLSRLAQ